MTEKYFNGLHLHFKTGKSTTLQNPTYIDLLNRLGDAAIYLSDWIRKRLH